VAGHHSIMLQCSNDWRGTELWSAGAPLAERQFMRSISDTMTRLAAMKTRATDFTRGNDRLVDLNAFGSNPGALRARTYTPKDLAPGAPLVVVLHGCTQNAAGYDHGSGWSQLADRHGFALLFPEQQRSNNANLCFNWFVPEDILRGGGEVLSIRQMIDAMTIEHALDRKRVFVTGLSAGGAMAAAMLATYPEVFAGGAVIAGLPFGSAATMPQASDRMRGIGIPGPKALQDVLRQASDYDGPWPTLSIWQGTADATVAPSNANALAAQWRKAHSLAEAPSRSESINGHRRSVWTDSDGREALELFSIAGMAHGTPLDVRAEGSLEQTMPFMIDAGISSTSHIAAFWGLAPAKRGQQQPTQPRPSQDPDPLEGEILGPEKDGDRQRGDSSQERTYLGADKTDIAKVIDDALLR
jgi:poly(hydroxyalkanoate) depolymerase family esterase